MFLMVKSHVLDVYTSPIFTSFGCSTELDELLLLEEETLLLEELEDMEEVLELFTLLVVSLEDVVNDVDISEETLLENSLLVLEPPKLQALSVNPKKAAMKKLICFFILSFLSI